MKKFFFTTLTLLSLITLAPAHATDDPAPEPNDKPCGDGICDQTEQKTQKCPQDCPDQDGTPPPGKKLLCGDGECDATEQKTQKCPQDCDESLQ